MRTTTAGLLARILADAGVKYVAGIPGHTNYAFADALLDEPRVMPITLRHEAAGAFAADAYFRVSGQLMGVFTHTLAGTANALAGVGNAFTEYSAMLMIIGEEARESQGRGAYQELSRGIDGDVPQLVRHLTKRSWVCHSPLQIIEQSIRAIRTSTLGAPGPVALHVYYDLWETPVEIPKWPSLDGYLPATNDTRPSKESLESAAGALRKAKRPLIIAGNGVNLSRAQDELLALAEELQTPVCTTVTGKGAFAEDHRLSLGIVGWVGGSAANWASQNADVVLTIGARMSETATSSWQPNGSFNPSRTTLIQADVDPVMVANVFPVESALVGDAKAVLADLRDALEGYQAPTSWREAARQKQEEWIEVGRQAQAQLSLPLPVGPIVRQLREMTSGHPVNVVADVGKSHKWMAQQFEARKGDIFVNSMGAGTMGIGPFGAFGAALGRPEAKTIAWIGDGAMSMCLPILPTLAEYNTPILYMVIDDGSYGAVVNAQMGRYKRTGYSEFNANGANPGYRLDLAEVANACGVPSRRVESMDELTAALKWGLEHDGPTLLDVIIDRSSVAPNGGGFKLGDIWDKPIYPWMAHG